jgi:hypothetical protein
MQHTQAHTDTHRHLYRSIAVHARSYRHIHISRIIITYARAPLRRCEARHLSAARAARRTCDGWQPHGGRRPMHMPPDALPVSHHTALRCAALRCTVTHCALRRGSARLALQQLTKQYLPRLHLGLGRDRCAVQRIDGLLCAARQGLSRAPDTEYWSTPQRSSRCLTQPQPQPPPQS